jgi:hypothetical protein
MIEVRAFVALAGVGLVNVALALGEVPGRECPPARPTSVEALFAPCLVVAKADHPLGPEAVPPPWPAPVPLPPVPKPDGPAVARDRTSPPLEVEVTGTIPSR